MIILVEMALITPPVGLNLYVVQGSREKGPLTDVMLGVIPYALAMLAMVGLLILFPAIALFLPNTL
jgi:TRAP-type C4-dicarboxylate transport system permease large subunit